MLIWSWPKREINISNEKEKINCRETNNSSLIYELFCFEASQGLNFKPASLYRDHRAIFFSICSKIVQNNVKNNENKEVDNGPGKPKIDIFEVSGLGKFLHDRCNNGNQDEEACYRYHNSIVKICDFDEEGGVGNY